MSVKQPDALRFADELDELLFEDYPNHNEAAAELRRLHEAKNECGIGAGCCYQAARIAQLEEENDRLKKAVDRAAIAKGEKAC